MKKKIVLAVTLASLFSYGAKAIPQCKLTIGIPHTGFSIGSALGYANFSGKAKYDLNIQGKKFDQVSSLGSGFPVAGFFLEHGWKPFESPLYLGVEIFAKQENIKQNTGILKIESNNSFGACGKIGYLYKEYLFFLKSGVVSMGPVRKHTTIPMRNGLYEEKFSKRETGFLFGVGIDYAFKPNWSIGGEFSFERYKPIKISIPSMGTISYDANKTTTSVRLKYSF